MTLGPDDMRENKVQNKVRGAGSNYCELRKRKEAYVTFDTRHCEWRPIAPESPQGDEGRMGRGRELSLPWLGEGSGAQGVMAPWSICGNTQRCDCFSSCDGAGVFHVCVM